MIHVLRAGAGSEAFRSLFAALEQERERAGWLDLAPDPAPIETQLVPGAAGALGDGVWKSVAVEERRSVAVKARRGPPVLRDLVREHFRGCRLVLVHGEAALPVLRPHDGDWELLAPDGSIERLTTAELVRALRAPRLAGR